MSVPTSRIVCSGCGAEAAPLEPYPFACPNAGGDGDVDHVMRRRLELSRLEFPAADTGEPNPFVRYRTLLHAYHLGRAGELTDSDLVRLVRSLDDDVAQVDGHGFAATPYARSDRLSDRLGFSESGGVWVKDETGNVSGSHKARHLFGVLLQLAVAERLGLTNPLARHRLAIASCGNAALAAAVVAAAGRRALDVFVPVDAQLEVLERLESLGATVNVCPRRHATPGDPTYHRLQHALAAGSLPFTCQGNLNGLAVEGGQTLAYELAASGEPIDRLVVQVGGGALASACAAGLAEAVALGALPRLPKIDTVQTEGAWPLKRAFDAVRAHPGGLAYAVAHRSEFMWPWEPEPHSIAHGILDDETYDWVAVVEAMLTSGGMPVVVAEHTLALANAAARTETGIDVDTTGSSGLAGLIALREAGAVGDDERVAVLFTGVDRTHTSKRREHDEELSGTRHPVAQGL